jgi:hypothetical protein
VATHQGASSNAQLTSTWSVCHFICVDRPFNSDDLSPGFKLSDWRLSEKILFYTEVVIFLKRGA